MRNRLFCLFCSVFLLPVAVKATVVVKGELPANPHSLITFYRYVDYVSMAPLEITQVHTDGAGRFQANIPDSAGMLIKLIVENRSLSFYVLPGGEYAVGEAHNELGVKDVAGRPINQRIREMSGEFRDNWFPLFVDTITKEYRKDAPSDTVFRHWEAIERKYTADSTQPEYALLRYQAAICYLSFMHQLPGADQLMNNFERIYFNEAPIQERNPFYTQLLESYMSYRVVMHPLQRYHASPYNSMDQLIHEVNYFPGSRLRQLALVAGLNQEYFSERDVDAREVVNRRIQTEVLNRVTDPVIREMLLKVISENNRARIGNKFPLLSLKNEKNEIVNIADIKSDLILVDFWATWCWGCVEGMKSFPDWLRECGDKLTIVTISVDDNLQKMTSFLDRREKLPGVRSLYNGRTGGYLDKLMIRGYPTYILLNKNREIIAMPGYTSGVSGLLKAAL
ncbi:TlpA family protein disulfide reductase [Chitinophaga arvensicola]|uniref:Thiol-disulfide isomerase or thioredoxin n=1 Tax=Chitinophaga arvensicola TaxID=29529 RepID=A0A1I0REU5_9BACT|nr:TlpA disulfide reductase family protein [Chitinophaga arvensicola]SEW39175.1 Thiol-disulfide isomerase or thioredoxin [Chitinophaga arvensicola]